MFFDCFGITSEEQYKIVNITNDKVTIDHEICDENCTFDRKTGQWILTKNQEKKYYDAFGAKRRIKPF